MAALTRATTVRERGRPHLLRASSASPRARSPWPGERPLGANPAWPLSPPRCEAENTMAHAL
eukprot:2254431-Lingulodinium_polyedra.AAC.1